MVVHVTAAAAEGERTEEEEDDDDEKGGEQQRRRRQQPPSPLLRNRALLRRLHQLERALPTTQPTSELLLKLAKASVLHALSTPAACGLLSSLLGAERYDQQVR
jgi:hypothetical protein